MCVDHRSRSRQNTFGLEPLDRTASHRSQSAWLEAQERSAMVRYVPVWRSRHLLDSRPAAILWDRERAGNLPERASNDVFLGVWDGHPCFALDLSPLPEQELTASGEDAEFTDLRACAAALRPDEAALLAQARGILYWHRRHRFCGRCGSATESEEGGHVRVCRNPECGRRDFPRTDPAIITLVHDGDRCLLGRQARWPANLYSTLAGFVEPGEAAEEAVAREVEEESGIKVGSVHYHSSQPWPFPASLMLGFVAQATSREIQRGDGELEEARWFSLERMQRDLPAGSLSLPPPVSISHRLIEFWFDARSDVPLAELLARPA